MKKGTLTMDYFGSQSEHTVNSLKKRLDKAIEYRENPNLSVKKEAG